MLNPRHQVKLSLANVFLQVIGEGSPSVCHVKAVRRRPVVPVMKCSISRHHQLSHFQSRQVFNITIYVVLD